MADIIIFGAGKVADVADTLFRDAGEHRVAAFVVDRAYIQADTFRGRPVVPFDEVATHYPPDRYAAFVAIGYHDLNRPRAQRYEDLKGAGYTLATCVGRGAWVAEGALEGDNCLIMPQAVIEPGARLGNNVVVWSNTTVGHHSRLSDHVWLSGNTIIGGAAELGTRSFAALGVVVGNEVTVGADSFMGAGTRLTRCCGEKSVFIERDTETYRLDSDSFLRISKMR